MKSDSAKIDSQSGFTLVEVVLAILVVALGVLSVFTLFPTGLRASEDTVADTRAGMFAEAVFGQMRGGAEELVLWSDWSTPATFLDKTLKVRDVSVDIPLVADGNIKGNDGSVDFPKGSGQKIRYRLTITPDGVRYPMKLEVCDGQYGAFQFQSIFYTEFVYKGM
jgi:prepilin-type N-terminal cleavage/methylation domain-containing protein